MRSRPRSVAFLFLNASLSCLLNRRGCLSTSFIEHFSKIEDPRILKKCEHKLIDILVIAVCATICRFDESWDSVEEFGNERKDWFKKFLDLPNGIPSHDTFRRVFLLLNPSALNTCFVEWANSMREKIPDEIIAIDGKTLAGSRDGDIRKKGVHIVSAWANENKLILGQLKVDEKSNEITAIPKLLDLLDIKGCTVTIDAMGTQREIAKKIIEGEGDYVLGLKGNQGTLLDDVKTYIDDQLAPDINEKNYQILETTDADHGRIETRKFYLFTEIDWLEQRPNWAGLHGIAAIDSIVENKGKISTERRYFITSHTDVLKFSKSARAHWGIENSVHWILDVSFNEDNSTRKKGHSPENCAVLRHVVLNLLKREKSRKISVNRKRMMACIRPDYLEKIIFG